MYWEPDNEWLPARLTGRARYDLAKGRKVHHTLYCRDKAEEWVDFGAPAGHEDHAVWRGASVEVARLEEERCNEAAAAEALQQQDDEEEEEEEVDYGDCESDEDTEALKAQLRAAQAKKGKGRGKGKGKGAAAAASASPKPPAGGGFMAFAKKGVTVAAFGAALHDQWLCWSGGDAGAGESGTKRAAAGAAASAAAAAFAAGQTAASAVAAAECCIAVMEVAAESRSALLRAANESIARAKAKEVAATDQLAELMRQVDLAREAEAAAQRETGEALSARDHIRGAGDSEIAQLAFAAAERQDMGASGTMEASDSDGAAAVGGGSLCKRMCVCGNGDQADPMDTVS
jgi:hypothetical protein